LYTGEDGARVCHVATRVGEWLAEHGRGVTAVRPVACVVGDRVVLYPGLSGGPLSDLLRRPGQGVARCLERVGAALHALHRLPSAGAAASALLDRTRALHARLPAEPPLFTHGDFKAEHVWATPGGPTLIDFDTCRLGDPALDVGKFLAHLRLWHLAHDQAGLTQVQERFLAGYAPGAPEGRLLRARLWARPEER